MRQEIDTPQIKISTVIFIKRRFSPLPDRKVIKIKLGCLSFTQTTEGKPCA